MTSLHLSALVPAQTPTCDVVRLQSGNMNFVAAGQVRFNIPLEFYDCDGGLVTA